MTYFFDFFDGQDYSFFFKAVLASFLVFGSLILRSKTEGSRSFLRQDRNLLIAYVLVMIFYAGTRDMRLGTDTLNYYHFYFLNGINIPGFWEFFSYFQTDLLFEVVMYLTFPFRDFTVFTLALAIIFNGVLYLFVRRFSDYGRDGSSLILFLTFASAFSFYQLEVNIVRNGLSIVFLLLALHYLLKERYRETALFFIIAYLFHGTSLLPIVAMLLVHTTKKLPLKYFIAAYFVGIGLAMIGFGFHQIPFLQEINSEDFKRLVFSGDTTYRIGFRFDFVLYNTFFLIVFLKFSNLTNKVDIFLIRYYIITSVIFFLNFNIPFSDRVGLYSWIAIPLLIFNTIKNSYPNKKLYYSTLGALGYFIINYVILFPE